MTTPPSVIVLLTDQQRWDTTGFGGNPEGLTPNLDRIARSGVAFDVAVTPQPLCTPARASFQTGRFAASTGAFRNGIVPSTSGGTLAQSFRDAGYRTAYVGKWHLGNSSSRGPVAENERAGYEQWLAANSLEHTSEPYGTSLWDNDGNEVPLPGYRVDAVADAAIRLLAEDDERPLFLFVSFLEPHQQNRVDDYPAPDGYAEKYIDAWMPPDLAALGGNAREKLPGYYGMVKRLDEAIGRISDAIKSLGKEQSTIVAFTSDHGCHFKTRNWEYKRSVHDASVRVPLVLKGPGLPRGRFVEEVVSTLDLPATLLDAAGVAVPASFHSRSLLPLIWHQGPDPDDEAYIQVSESEVARGVRTRRWKYGVVGKDVDPLINPHAQVYVEAYLYDLLSDPWEMNNLVGYPSHREVSDRLRVKLSEWMIRAEELPAVIEQLSREAPQHSQYVVRADELPS